MDEETIRAHADKYYRNVGGVRSVVLKLVKDGKEYYSVKLNDTRPMYLGIPIFFEVEGETIRDIMGRESLELMDEIREYRESMGPFNFDDNS